MENTLYEILENVFTQEFKLEQLISEPTKKWSGHSRCEEMEFLFSKDRELVVMKSPDSPSWVIKPDHQLSLARWLKNEVPKANLWSPDEQTLYFATVTIGKAKVEIAVIVSKKIEVALDAQERKAA